MTPRPHRRSRPRRTSAWFAALCVVALLGLQALGLAHKVAHVPAGPGPAAQAQALAWADTSARAHADEHADAHAADEGHAGHAHPTGPDAHRWAGQFGHDPHAESCRLYDQSSLADAGVAVLPTAVPLPAAALRVAAAPAPAVVAVWQPQRARAPPIPA